MQKLPSGGIRNQYSPSTNAFIIQDTSSLAPVSSRVSMWAGLIQSWATGLNWALARPGDPGGEKVPPF